MLLFSLMLLAAPMSITGSMQSAGQSATKTALSKGAAAKSNLDKQVLSLENSIKNSDPKKPGTNQAKKALASLKRLVTSLSNTLKALAGSPSPARLARLSARIDNISTRATQLSESAERQLGEPQLASNTAEPELSSNGATSKVPQGSGALLSTVAVDSVTAPVPVGCTPCPAASTFNECANAPGVCPKENKENPESVK